MPVDEKRPMDQGHQTAKPVNFENVLEKLTPTFRYQATQIVQIYMYYMCVAMASLNFVFIGYEPHHTCAWTNETELLTNLDLWNDTTVKVIYETCQIRVTSNESGRSGDVATMGCISGHSYEGGKGVSMKTEWDLVCERQGMAEMSQTVFSLGTLFGSLIATMLADRFGRKKMIVVCSVASLFFEIGVTFSPSITVLSILKFFTGAVMMGITLTPSVLGDELLVLRHRPAYSMGGGIVWAVYLALLGALAYVLRLNNWRDLQLTTALTALLPIIFTYFLDESLSWLFAQGRHVDAQKIIKKASKMNGLNYNEVKEVYDECVRTAKRNKALETHPVYKKSKESDYNVLDILRHRKLRVFTVMLLMLWVTCNMAYYGLYLTSAALVHNRFLSFVLLSLVDMLGLTVVAFVASCSRNSIARRKVIAVTMAVAATCLLISACLAGTESEKDHDSRHVMSAFYLMGTMSISACYTCLFWYTPEVYPTTLRTTGVGISSCLSRVGGMIAPFLFPLYQMAAWAPGTILTALCLISLILILFLPETNGWTLPTCIEDIDMWMEEGKKTDDKRSPHSSSSPCI